MCGIIGITGEKPAGPVLLQGLKRLEYRGYDSAGIAVQNENEIEIVKVKGSVSGLAEKTDGGRSIKGYCGIGHTRWATHGKPDECNAHPHASPDKRVVVVHNGIIENHMEITNELKQIGCVFSTQTDTEAAVLLLDHLYMDEKKVRLNLQGKAVSAIREMMSRLTGSWAMCILFGDQPGRIYAVRMGSPLIAGVAREKMTGNMIASDAAALLSGTRHVIHMEDGEIACLSPDEICFFDTQGNLIDKRAERISIDEDDAEKGTYAHYMLKEIGEQPLAVRRTIAPYIKTEGESLRIDLSAAAIPKKNLEGVKKLCLIGCGSAYHAACVGKAVIERLARIPCETQLASEFRYREFLFEEGALAVIISQSGETADSLAALRLCKKRGIPVLVIVNVPESAMVREADFTLMTCAGPEISVATTKAYAAQLAALYLLAIGLAVQRNAITREREAQLAAALIALPEKLEEAITSAYGLRRLAEDIALCRDVFFVGRGLDYAAAMEGSLKLKEISYIHSEAYAAGELKHGSISLIEKGVPVIAIATQEALLLKTSANLEETKSRGAMPVMITQKKWERQLTVDASVLCVPDTEELFAASLTAVPLQLLAYWVSCFKGLDADKPRNLAKSVTVE